MGESYLMNIVGLLIFRSHTMFDLSKESLLQMDKMETVSKQVMFFMITSDMIFSMDS